jgi:hypothetical protein
VLLRSDATQRNVLNCGVPDTAISVIAAVERQDTPTLDGNTAANARTTRSE